MAKDDIYGAPWTPEGLKEAQRFLESQAKGEESQQAILEHAAKDKYPFSEVGRYLKHGKGGLVSCKVLKKEVSRSEAWDYYNSSATLDIKTAICNNCLFGCFN